MDREQIVAEFFEKGHLLTEEALKVVEEKGADYRSDLPTVIRAADLYVPYKILKNITQKKNEIAKEDFVKFYNSKYEKMRDIIVSRVPRDFVSLNKIDNTRNELHVVGIVREIKEKDGKKVVDLEDKTATVPVIFDSTEDLELDDVVAIRAVAAGKVLFGKKIIYPDIPLRTPTLGTGKACFISDLRLDEAPTADVTNFFEWFSRTEIPYLFIAGGVRNREQLAGYVDRYCYLKTVFVISESDEHPGLPDSYDSKRIVAVSSPALVEVGGLKVLCIRAGDTSLLKKRYMNKSRAIFDEDLLVLDDVPDIMHTGGEQPLLANYKSVTLVSSGSMMGEFKPIIVDFATRDAEKVTL